MIGVATLILATLVGCGDAEVVSPSEPTITHCAHLHRDPPNGPIGRVSVPDDLTISLVSFAFEAANGAPGETIKGAPVKSGENGVGLDQPSPTGIEMVASGSFRTGFDTHDGSIVAAGSKLVSCSVTVATADGEVRLSTDISGLAADETGNYGCDTGVSNKCSVKAGMSQTESIEADEAVSSPATSSAAPATTNVPPPMAAPAGSTTVPPFDPETNFDARYVAAFGIAPEVGLYRAIVDACETVSVASDRALAELFHLKEDRSVLVETMGLVCPTVSDRIVTSLNVPAEWPLDSAPRAAQEPSSPPAGDVVAVTRIVDGDTIETSIGTIRIIGYDSPEAGEPCHDEATRRLEQLLGAGTAVVITETGHDDTDDYGRLLRHVYGSADPVGATLIGDHLAIARYDSQDGYGWHRHETEYRGLSDGIACSPALTTTTSTSSPPAPPRSDPTAPNRDNNPYDDGGPRNQDGSCPPGGCWPGT